MSDATSRYYDDWNGSMVRAGFTYDDKFHGWWKETYPKPTALDPLGQNKTVYTIHHDAQGWRPVARTPRVGKHWSPPDLYPTASAAYMAAELASWSDLV